MYVNGQYYKYYPFIREEDINKNTGNKFVDTLKVSNLYLKGLNGDRKFHHGPFSIAIQS